MPNDFPNGAKTKTIVVVDDEPEVLEIVSGYLGERGFEIEGFREGKKLLAFLEKKVPDLVVLDLTLPDMHGFEVCRQMKQDERFRDIPVIILSADTAETHKVSGLDMGADDYVVKPFSLSELSARIKAVLRRRGKWEEGTISIGDVIEINIPEHKLQVSGKEVELTALEFNILKFLLLNKNEVISRKRFLAELWSGEKAVTERTIDVHIKHIREKLGEAGRLIKNIRGVGYKIEGK